MSNRGPERLAASLLKSGTFRWLVALLTLGTGIIALLAAIGGVFEEAGQIASISAAFATVLLVSLTAQYADQTEQLVEQTELDREQRKELKREEFDRELDSIRRALHEEISKVQYFDRLAEEYSLSNAALGIATASTVYESNAPKIGLLTDEEVDNIVEDYTRLERASDAITYQRKRDTMIDKDGVEMLFYKWRKFRERRAVETSENTPVENRKEMVAEQLGKLSEAQDRALAAIERELDGTKSKNRSETPSS